ncbi:MAG: DNA polymerase III subunit delta' [bacterium]|nr:DNA polymerase III subunit delta' [bacterium]
MFNKAVVGQHRVVAILTRMVQSKRIPHALMFYGPPGMGTVAAALETARSLHCERPDGGSCGTCRGCHKTEALNHPDFSLLFPFPSRVTQEAERMALQGVLSNPYGYSFPEDSTVLSIERIRALQKQFSYGSYEGAWRTAVILHAERMRPEAANALLKTLEEPPGRSLLILTAPSQDAMLPTIVSRCQGVKFAPLATRDVEGALVAEAGVGAEETGFIARASGGNLRLAREMAGGEVREAQDRAFRFLDALLWGEEYKTYTALEQLVSDRQGTMQMLDGAELWLRDVLLVSGDNAEYVSHHGRLDDVKRLAEAFTMDRLQETVSKIESLREMNSRNVNLHTGLVSLWRQVRRYGQGVGN